MDIQIKTRTPLWTGGVATGQVDRLHETGIIGGLRWWYEAIIRGMGGTACDPGQGECQFDARKYAASSATDTHQRLRDAGLCDVCQVFGATGWRRRFRLEIVNDTTCPVWAGHTPLNIRPPDRNRGWFLPPGVMGSFTLRFHGDAAIQAQLAWLLLFLERWGHLGARAQLGYGVFAIENRAEVAQFASNLAPPWGTVGDSAPDNAYPNLQNFGFFRYRFQPQHPGWWTQLPGFERVTTRIRPLVATHQTVPLTPVLKNVWRFQLWQPAWGDERTFWGTLGRERIRSKVLVSWAYPQDGMWTIHGSAWLQGVQDRQAVWAMFCNPTCWEQALGIAGELQAFPAATWQPWSGTTLRAFLET